jgi:hypothetical protein
MKVSQVKRRIKRRSERKSRHNNKANLVRSRKQRARKTARKMMRGGAGDTNVVDDAISLKFSGKDKLFISIDINKHQGDVRRTLDLLFHIDGFDPIKTHNQTFLMGLADYPGRKKTTELALDEVTNGGCGDVHDEAKTKVKKLIDKTFSTVNVCNLEIELKEVNGDITCIVKKYHRMKIGETSCMWKEIESGPGDVRDWRVLDVHTKGLYYPKLEIADSNPKGLLGLGGGVDYMDTITGKVYRDQKNNLFTFTVKGKTIDGLKSELINLKSITPAIEEQKNKEAAEAAVKQAEEARENNPETKFDRVSHNNNVKDKDKIKEAIKVISPFISWIIKWRQKNNYDDWIITWEEKSKYKPIEEKLEEFSKKRQEINKEFESEYTPEERDKITESLKICRQEYYHKFTKHANDAKIFRKYLKSMISMSMNYDYKIDYGLREYFNLNDNYVEDYAKNEITALWNQVFYMPYDYD